MSEQTVVSNGLPAVGNPNKSKICYKCQQEGHVRSYLVRMIYDYSEDNGQIARDCPQIAEFAA